jgi:hypothetical protein
MRHGVLPMTPDDVELILRVQRLKEEACWHYHLQNPGASEKQFDTFWTVRLLPKVLERLKAERLVAPQAPDPPADEVLPPYPARPKRAAQKPKKPKACKRCNFPLEAGRCIWCD